MALSPASRVLTGLFGALSAVVGAVLFLAPAWSADEFAWRVSDFVAMTMGGWCLGNAVEAWVAVRAWRWPANHAVLVYLWAFAVLQVGVVVWFRDSLRLDGAMAWPYLALLAAGVLAAARGVAEAARLRPFPPATTGLPVPRAVRAAVIAFVLFVGFLALFGLVATGFGASRRVFPEALSPFTLRAFAAFYLALAVGALPLVQATSLEPTVAYMRGGMGLIVPITAAAFVYIGRFDVSAHPGQVAYIAAYLAVAAGVLVVQASVRRRSPAPGGAGPS